MRADKRRGWEERRGCSSPGPTPIPWAGGMEWEELKCGRADFRRVQS